MEQDWAQMCYLSCLNCLFLDSVAQTAFAQQLNTMLTASWNTLGQELLQGFGTWLSDQHTEKKLVLGKLKSGLKYKHFFFSFFVCKPLPSPAKCWFFCFIIWTLHLPLLSPPHTHTQIEVALISQKLNQWSLRKTGQNLYVMGKLPESCVCKKWAVRTKQKPNCTLSKRGIRYFSNKSSAFLLLSNKSNSHWRNSCLSRRLSYKLAK